MKINSIAKAGTLESNDIYVVLMPNEDDNIKIELDSIVIKQFGDAIKETIINTLKELDITSVTVNAQDKGALDYTIKARIETAVKRAMEAQQEG